MSGTKLKIVPSEITPPLKFTESMIESLFQMNMSFIVVKNYGIVGELQFHSLVLSTVSIASNFARRYAYTKSNKGDIYVPKY